MNQLKTRLVYPRKVGNAIGALTSVDYLERQQPMRAILDD